MLHALCVSAFFLACSLLESLKRKKRLYPESANRWHARPGDKGLTGYHWGPGLWPKI